MVPAVVAALFGSSWHLVSGPTTATSIVMFSALSKFAAPGSEQYIAMAITLTFMVGVIQFAMGIARMGALVNFISHSVIVGFTTGAAILIITKQMENFFGIELPDADHFYETIYYSWNHWADIHPLVSLVALATLFIGILARELWPKVPALLIALPAVSSPPTSPPARSTGAARITTRAPEHPWLPFSPDCSWWFWCCWSPR